MEKMIGCSFNFNKLKSLLTSMAEEGGVSSSQLQDWALDYSSDFNGDFLREMFTLSECVRVANLAKEAGDLLALKFAIVILAVRAGMLASFMEELDADLTRLLREFEWPTLPDDYQIPSAYNYRGIK